MADPTKYAFKVLHGTHREGRKRYVKGDVVCTNFELDKIHNNGGVVKYLRLDEQAHLNAMAKLGYDSSFKTEVPQATPTTDDLDKMSIEDLKLHAQDEEIDLKGVNLKVKKAIIAAITRHKTVTK
jgi:hypothetical protein